MHLLLQELLYIYLCTILVVELDINNNNIVYRFNALHMHENKLSMCQEEALVLVGAFSVIVKLQY